MIGYLDVGAERLHETSKRSVIQVDGLLGISGVRAIVRNRPQQQDRKSVV